MKKVAKGIYMNDPFTFDPTKMVWETGRDADGRSFLGVCYRVPGVTDIGMTHYLDDRVLADPLQLAGVVAQETRRVILSFQHIVARLSSHEKLAWLAASRSG
ncbi:hypothetical protein [Paracoccus sp. SSK6]|uniref:hypothetical protein n=1 Tax=Paracoccus sp. SSK6 TaxID=3143131 RepID=UPI00321A1847